jgi:hypothetical protein
MKLRNKRSKINEKKKSLTYSRFVRYCRYRRGGGVIAAVSFEP